MPNPEYFKTKKEYLNWYRDYREKNREKLRKYNREYQIRVWIVLFSLPPIIKWGLEILRVW